MKEGWQYALILMSGAAVAVFWMYRHEDFSGLFLALAVMWALFALTYKA